MDFFEKIFNWIITVFSKEKSSDSSEKETSLSYTNNSVNQNKNSGTINNTTINKSININGSNNTVDLSPGISVEKNMDADDCCTLNIESRN